MSLHHGAALMLFALSGSLPRLLGRVIGFFLLLVVVLAVLVKREHLKGEADFLKTRLRSTLLSGPTRSSRQDLVNEASTNQKVSVLPLRRKYIVQTSGLRSFSSLGLVEKIQ